jgi:hypothetical protein
MITRQYFNREGRMSWYDQPYIIIDGEYRCVINHGLPSMGTRRQYRCVIYHGLPYIHINHNDTGVVFDKIIKLFVQTLFIVALKVCISWSGFLEMFNLPCQETD